MKEQRILLLDNYDSFTYNILHYVEELTGSACDVIRNDAFDLKYLVNYDSIILSPGPGLPEEAGVLISLIKQAYQNKKILGVCLGHQALAVAFNGTLKQLDNVMHGLQRNCTVIDHADPLYSNLPKSFPAGRYHSWVVDEKNLPHDFIITAVDDEKNIMSMRHLQYSLFGVQFHPESIMTPAGKQIIRNWLEI